MAGAPVESDAVAALDFLFFLVCARVIRFSWICHYTSGFASAARVLGVPLRLYIYMAPLFIIALIQFGRNCIGLVTRPYETCRRIAEKENARELVFLGILVALVKFSSLYTYFFVIVLFWGMGRLVGSKAPLKGLAVLWGYSLIPTTLWFLVTLLLSVVLPPPRTTSPLGILFSVVFLIFSMTMLFWKGTMTYLSLRFGLRLQLWQILVVLGVTFPILAVYSVAMYRLGIFRIPFI